MGRIIQFRGQPVWCPILPSQEWCREWGGRIVSIGGIATSFALRAANLARWTNATMPAVAGGFTQHLIESFATPPSLPMVKKVTATTFGFSLIYAADQFWENDILPELDTTTIVFTFGSASYIFIKWLIVKRFLAPVEIPDGETAHLIAAQVEVEGEEDLEEPFMTTEEDPLPETEGQQSFKIPGMFPTQRTKYVTRGLASIALGTGIFFVKDEGARLYMGSLIEYYATESLGDFVMLRLIATVQKRDDLERHLSFVNKKGTYFRTLMKGLVTLAYIGIPFYLTPIFGDPHTLSRAYQLFYSTPLVGFFYGLMLTALRSRIENTSIQELEELKEISHEGYRRWMKRFRNLVSAGFYGFGIFQLATLSDTAQRIGMLVSMLSFFVGDRITASANNWNRDERMGEEAFLQRHRQMTWQNKTWKQIWRAFKIESRDKFLFSGLLLQRVPLPNILDPLVPPPTLAANFMLNLNRANSGAVSTASIAGQVAIDATLVADIFAWKLELGRTSSKKMGVDGQLLHHGTIAGANTVVRVWRGIVQ